MTVPVNIFWFRRDLRLEDNHGLFRALDDDLPVLPVFIFDKNILDELPEDDARVSFIYKHLEVINERLKEKGGSLYILHDSPLNAFKKITTEFVIKNVYANHDYEPYAIARDENIRQFLERKDITFKTYKDQVIFEKNEVVKSDGYPYIVYRPYSRQWLSQLKSEHYESYTSNRKLSSLLHTKPFAFPSLKDIGFRQSNLDFPSAYINEDIIDTYEKTRDYPYQQHGTTHSGVHLRFGTISVRELVRIAKEHNQTYLKELIWREFFMQILYHFPHVVKESFRKKYDAIEWRNNKQEFQKWCKGKTGYPIVDAGMRELNETGYMHNRVRMIAASFLVKQLLIDWRWGEAYFAEKLLDYELASNNGNWQWAAGTGCDAAPYFRIFNPTSQQEKFDTDFKYIKKWVPEHCTDQYPEPMVDYKMSRERALETYRAVS